jgi:hypothetical protein
VNNRDDSILSEEQDDTEIKIYVNNSGQDNNTGAGAVLYRRDQTNPEKILRFHLGMLKQHINYEAEAIRLLLTMWILRNQHVIWILNIAIYVDSQILLKAIQKSTSQPGQYLIEVVLQQVEMINRIKNRSM